ncbi:hypothetical protein K450DRAFT_250910 [Umbelopsis ramanniana AG]|uniref:Uncharacterized protein n=1 Tax=Umbelopsis ramanniana AG TaxID=1314678 RepID=A0AAD5HB52_UMBRA|nr:uncharacterized protein K450DRAFT_250910 [Umbelopsis ramanniana AG]KAI8577622.1 hypothetical protein K450DRAFT_250910 [Umbelopsis ramanniana AG]
MCRMNIIIMSSLCPLHDWNFFFLGASIIFVGQVLFWDKASFLSSFPLSLSCLIC